ncbi:MAG: hypothetical protein JWR69_1641 [Pedosphaera sp.]|nr:hypothetical protein [Pedosphaera sp.]
MREQSRARFDIVTVKLSTAVRARHFHGVHERVVNLTDFRGSTRITEGSTPGDQSNREGRQRKNFTHNFLSIRPSDAFACRDTMPETLSEASRHTERRPGKIA